MVNRKLPNHSTVNSNFLPNLNGRDGREVDSLNLLSSGSRSIKISSPSSKRPKSKHRKKARDENSQPTVENLYKNLLNVTSKYRAEKQQGVASRSNKFYGGNIEQLQLGVSALNSFVIAAGNIYHCNRLIKYVVREIMGTCFSIDLLVPITEQTWTIFVPTYEPVKELMRVWKRRNGTKFEDPADMDKLCTWLLSCIQLQFNQASVIVSSQFNQDLFQKCYTQEIKNNVQRAAIIIQSSARRFLSNNHLREELKKIQSVNQNRTLALIRVRNNKKSTTSTALVEDKAVNESRAIDHTGKGIFSRDFNKDARISEEIEKSFTDARQRGLRIDNTSLEFQRSIENETPGNVQFNVHPPPNSVKPSAERRSRPTFSGNLKNYNEDSYNIHDVTLNEESISTEASNREASNQVNPQPIDEPYVSFFEQNPTQANELTKQKFWTTSNSHKTNGNQNNASLTYPPPENGGQNNSSLLSLIRSHNVNILNKRNRKLQDPKGAAVYWMRQEIAALLHKVETLEYDLYEQRSMNEQTENVLKIELFKARKNAVRVAERMAKRAKEAAVEEVTVRLTELQLEIEKAESEREAILLHELDTMQRRWVKRWKKKKVSNGRSGGDGNTSDYRGEGEYGERNNGDSWIDKAAEGGDEDDGDDASETSLERRLRMNSLTRKTRKVRRSRKPMTSSIDSGGANSNSVEDEELGEGEQSETSLEKRIRLNALNRKDRQNKKSRRNPGSQVFGGDEEGSGSIENLLRESSTSLEEIADDDDGASETSMERRIRLNASKRGERKNKRSRNPKTVTLVEENSMNDSIESVPDLTEDDARAMAIIARSKSPTARRERDRKSRKSRGRGRSKDRRMQLNSLALSSPINEMSEYESQQEEEDDEGSEVIAAAVTTRGTNDATELPPTSATADDQSDDAAGKKVSQQQPVPATKEPSTADTAIVSPSSPIPARASSVAQPTPPVSKRPGDDTAPRAIRIKKDLEVVDKLPDTNTAPAPISTTVAKEVPVEIPSVESALIANNLSAKISKPSILTRSLSLFSSPKSSPKVLLTEEDKPTGRTAISDALPSTLSVATAVVVGSPGVSTKEAVISKSVKEEKPVITADVDSGKQSKKIIINNDSVKAIQKSTLVDVNVAEEKIEAAPTSRKNTPGSASGKRTINRPSSSRSGRKMLKSGGKEEQLELLSKQNSASMKIQGALKLHCRRRKYAKSDKNLSVLRADSLLRIIDSTRDENILHKAFTTAMELEYLLLATKSVNRSVELLAKYFKSGVVFPVDIYLLLDCVHFFLKVDKTLVDHGFDALAVVVKLKPETLTSDNPELCELIIQTIASYTSDPLLCFKATKCLYRMCEKNVPNRLSLGQLEGCLVMKSLCDVHVKNTSLVENFAKCLINLCINCSENQDMLGEVGICDSIFAAFNEHLSSERLFYLLCRSIINLCAGNHRPNQDRLAKGDYPNAFIAAIKVYKAFPKAMEQIITCILSIVANNKPNKQKFLDVGICEVLLDLVAQTADSAILGNCFWAISTLLSATVSDGKQKELFDRTIEILREYENDKKDKEISMQATIAINRMMRSSSAKGTPVAYVPVKRPNTGNILDKL